LASERDTLSVVNGKLRYIYTWDTKRWRRRTIT